jgi:hypothetical protein
VFILYQLVNVLFCAFCKVVDPEMSQEWPGMATEALLFAELALKCMEMRCVHAVKRFLAHYDE